MISFVFKGLQPRPSGALSQRERRGVALNRLKFNYWHADQFSLSVTHWCQINASLIGQMLNYFWPAAPCHSWFLFLPFLLGSPFLPGAHRFYPECIQREREKEREREREKGREGVRCTESARDGSVCRRCRRDTDRKVHSCSCQLRCAINSDK